MAQCVVETKYSSMRDTVRPESQTRATLSIDKAAGVIADCTPVRRPVCASLCLIRLDSNRQNNGAII